MADLPFKPVEKVIDIVLEASIRQLDYIINYKDHEQGLKQHIATLESNKKTVDERVPVAKDNAEEITPAAQDWLKRVERKMEESKEFHDDKMLDSKTSCFSGGCSFLWNRRQLGRKAKKILAPTIKQLNQETPDILANISHPPAPTFADSNPLDGDYLEFESRKGIIEKILEQLKDPTVRMVGLHGPSGVGKTSLVKQIAKQAGDSKLFDKVVMAIVKKDPDLLKVQQDIADGLRLTFGNIGENGRATLLRKRLKQENTFVILDDLWDELDLNKIGIPFHDDDVVSSHVPSSKKEEKEQTASENSPGSSGTSKRGCKILVTSRYKEVLLGYSDIVKKVVEMSNEIPKFKPETLHNYCAGLPMAVIIVGRWLMKKNKLEWEGELERLKNQQGSNEVHRYMESSVKMGYDHLESEELKSIFLVCAQMYHQSLIVDLVKYCYGLGILNDVHTLTGARQSISKSIQILKDSGLLDSTSNDNFNMHDIVRDAALSIACKNQNVFTLRNKTLDVWPHKEQLERYSAIYLHKCHIVDGLPERVNCPRLTFFYIDCDGSTLKIPDTFFEGMEELRILVLSGIHLQSLPSSIKCLPNLRMLCLEKCTLGDLSILNHLRKLRILSLSGSRIEYWPTDLDGLSKLQFLDISNCFISSSTRSLSLSSFPNLEELYIENSLNKMEVEGQINHSQISALSELKHLHQLNTLDVYIPSAELLPADLFFHELNDYKIVIGDFETISIGDFKMPKKYEASRSLALQLEPSMDIHSLKGVKLLFKGVVNFLLGELHGVQNVFYELNLNGFPDLKHFSIVNNNDIEYIVNSMELSQPHDAFPSLEFLSLFNLKNIKKICCSPITNSSFSRLKIIKLKMCPQLKSIFFFYIVEFLTSLETIDVSECDSLQAVISKEEGSNKVVLHKLCSLTLQKLPSFVSFYNNSDRPLEPESMEKQARIIDDIGIVPAEDEQSSTTSFSLFDENVEIPKLESLKLFSIKIHSIWSDRISNDWFQNLIKLTLENCNLTYLCSLSMARSLNKLKSISIIKCSLMEKLFISEENNNEYSKDCIFPKLEEIQLSGMEMLKEIWPCEDEVRADSFSSLISVDISQCNKIDKIFPSHMKCCYLSLKTLKVSSCEWVEFIFKSRLPSQQSGTNKSALLEVIDLHDLPYLKQVWSEDPKGVVNFTNLQSIKISFCNTLSYVLPASIAKDLGKLESFSIYSCRNLEEIIACDGGSETSNEPPLMFPEVVSMSFRKLPSIRCLYKGRHIVECPKLKQLTMIECPNLKICKTESANEEEGASLSAEKVKVLTKTFNIIVFYSLYPPHHGHDLIDIKHKLMEKLLL
ncbi:probable disease resistance protein At4g27220 [Arachis duranensis]|uniref:Probable disease resistance protein At4g27220 n=1 Tax=Arachis duranensis TaxID=130453 RepID=A0A6P5N4F0_ARADU|nr:probable disease resistance protein At4g27220 [Arachis duranensis]